MTESAASWIRSGRVDRKAAAGREFGGSRIFDKALICDNYALGLLASNVAGGLSLDRIEDKGVAFQERVASGYRRYAQKVGGCVVLRGDRDPESVAHEVFAEVRRALA